MPDMSVKQAKEILENELRCVESSDNCSRVCQECPLVREQSDVVQAYKVAIEYLDIEIRNQKHGSELKRMIAEHDEIMNRPIGGGNSKRMC